MAAPCVRRQRVQTRAFTIRPAMETIPVCRLGRKRRLVRRFE